MRPKVALTESVFMMIALIGTSTDRKAIASMTAVAPRMSGDEQGKPFQQIGLEVERRGGVAADGEPHAARCPAARDPSQGAGPAPPRPWRW